MTDVHPKVRRLRFRQGVLLSLFCWLLLSVLHLTGAFGVIDLKLVDIRFRLRGERKASDRIALVEVDDATIAAYERWPLSRDTYALLIAAIADAGARGIGVDLLFVDRDKEKPQSDILLSEVTAAFPNVVHAIAFLPEGSAKARDEALPQERQRLLIRHGIEGSSIKAARAGTILLPFTELLAAAPALGHVTVALDRDGGYRRLPLLVRYQDRLYPAMGLRLAGMAAGRDSLPKVEPTRGGFVLRWPDGWWVNVPVDNEGGTAIDFAGDRTAFPLSYSMLDVLRWYREGNRAKLTDAFKGRIVLIGSTAVAQAATDVGTTPFATATPLVYVHANVTDALLNSRFIHGVRSVSFLIFLAGLSIFLGWLFVIFPLPIAAAAMVGATAVVAASEYLAFVILHLNVPSTAPLLLPPLVYASTASYRFVFLEKRTAEQEKELMVARTIQAKLLPAEPLELPELDVFGINIPAKEVGGDYFDWLALGDRTFAVVVGDVSGKGVSAALLMSHLHASFHAEVRVSVAPKAILDAMNLSLFRATEPHRFATFFLALIPREEEKLVYANAGHGPTLLVSGGKVESLGPTGVPLGLFDSMQYGEETRPFHPGDFLVLCSDGVTECDRDRELYGEERLLALVDKLAAGGLASGSSFAKQKAGSPPAKQEVRSLSTEQLAGGSLSARQMTSPPSAEEIGKSILADIRSFCRGENYADDVTIVVVRRR